MQVNLWQAQPEPWGLGGVLPKAYQNPEFIAENNTPGELASAMGQIARPVEVLGAKLQTQAQGLAAKQAGMVEKENEAADTLSVTAHLNNYATQLKAQQQKLIDGLNSGTIKPSDTQSQWNTLAKQVTPPDISVTSTEAGRNYLALHTRQTRDEFNSQIPGLQHKATVQNGVAEAGGIVQGLMSNLQANPSPEAMKYTTAELGNVRDTLQTLMGPVAAQKWYNDQRDSMAATVVQGRMQTAAAYADNNDPTQAVASAKELYNDIGQDQLGLPLIPEAKASLLTVVNGKIQQYQNQVLSLQNKRNAVAKVLYNQTMDSQTKYNVQYTPDQAKQLNDQTKGTPYEGLGDTVLQNQKASLDEATKSLQQQIDDTQTQITDARNSGANPKQMQYLNLRLKTAQNDMNLAQTDPLSLAVKTQGIQLQPMTMDNMLKVAASGDYSSVKQELNKRIVAVDTINRQQGGNSSFNIFQGSEAKSLGQALGALPDAQAMQFLGLLSDNVSDPRVLEDSGKALVKNGAGMKYVYAMDALNRSHFLPSPSNAGLETPEQSATYAMTGVNLQKDKSIYLNSSETTGSFANFNTEIGNTLPPDSTQQGHALRMQYFNEVKSYILAKKYAGGDTGDFGGYLSSGDIDDALKVLGGLPVSLHGGSKNLTAPPGYSESEFRSVFDNEVDKVINSGEVPRNQLEGWFGIRDYTGIPTKVSGVYILSTDGVTPVYDKNKRPLLITVGREPVK
jgi:hypothetical protein